MNTVSFVGTGFLYEGNSLHEAKTVKFNVTVQVSVHSATS